MEANIRWTAITAIAPVAWGANYFVTREYLPAGYPLYGGVIRALPAGLLLLALSRQLPSGSWWWRSVVLGILNVGAFFVLIYLAATYLPTSIASTIMGTSPIALMLFAWALAGERPRLAALAGAVLGIAGVCLMLLNGAVVLSPLGVLASVAAMVMSSAGYVLAKRWGSQVAPLAVTSWQLIAGGILLLPAAAVAEGPPPRVGLAAIMAFGYVTTIATALAFAAWFAGLRHLPAAAVGLIGLLNPVTGVLLGTSMAGELMTARQLTGLLVVLAGLLAGQPAAATLARRARCFRWAAPGGLRGDQDARGRCVS